MSNSGDWLGPISHRLDPWVPDSLNHPHKDRIGVLVPLCDVRKVDFLAWSAQASLTVFLRQVMKESMIRNKEIKLDGP